MTELQGHLKSDRFASVFTDIDSYHNLQNLSIEELRELNKMVIATIKQKRDNKGLSIRLNLSIGDIVEVSDKKFLNEVLEVVKLNPKKAQLKRDNGDVWNIPYSMITL